MEINGLPAHMLIVHAAVVFLPLASVLALVYAGVPRWRWATRWPMVGFTTVALAARSCRRTSRAGAFSTASPS